MFMPQREFDRFDSSESTRLVLVETTLMLFYCRLEMVFHHLQGRDGMDLDPTEWALLSYINTIDHLVFNGESEL